jgi:hypothetical protein
MKTFYWKILSTILLLAIGGSGPLLSQSIQSTGTSTSSTGAIKVTVNTPPNDVISGPTNLTGTGTVTVSSQGSGSVGIIASGSGTGLTFGFQGSVDGTNYITIPCVVPSTGAIATSGNANGTWTCQAAGYQTVRVNLTAIGGGTETFTLNASAGSNQPPIGTQGTATNLTAVNGVAIAGGASGQLPINQFPATAGGLSIFFLQPTASDNHAVIKAGAGQVYKITAFNNSATVNYLRLYNATTGFNGCNSATNLVYQAQIPASTSVGGFSDSWESGMAFATGISICVSSGYAQTDTTNATATAMSVNVGYK